MSQELLDLEELVRVWVNDFPLDKSQRKDADDIVSTDINWKHVRIHHGNTEYYDQVKQSTPKTHVLFTAHFTNDTDQEQVYTLKTERTTKSTCNIMMEKCYTIGFNLEIKLCPPNPVIQANAGFKGEMSVKKADEESFEEQLVWSVDNQITVPPKYKTKADLVLKEDEYTSHFKCETKFEGKIHVTLRSKKDNTPITTITGDVRHIFRSDQGFRVDKTGIYYVSQGRCKCRFGIEQHVKLSQIALKDAVETDENENSS
ncbi:uncharacterized protein LOC127853347 isoform X2 [Dreissena polymorpha]|nr:uncharacterized protein LOC127853347 isoform X2 [Dreissena polymorpha]